MTQTPTAVSDEHGDHPAMARIQTLSHLLDEAIRIPGTNIRIGLDPILGILPGAGDTAASLLSLYIVLEGVRVGAPTELLAKMVALIAVDAVIGSVPVLGTIFDAFWKANTWNVNLLAAHLEERTTPPADPSDRSPVP